MRKTKFTERQIRILRNEAEEQNEKIRGARFWRNLDFLLYLCVVVLVAFGIRAFLFEPIRVIGESMTPTLADGEHMFVEKVSYWLHAPERGDIIICFYPGYTESCVKRVIGLPGETVEVREGKVYINDAPLDEADYWAGTIFADSPKVSVPDNSVFVMGDNRNGSKDSRNSTVGAIPYTEIVGKVQAVIWPFDQMELVKRVNY